MRRSYLKRVLGPGLVLVVCAPLRHATAALTAEGSAAVTSPDPGQVSGHVSVVSEETISVTKTGNKQEFAYVRARQQTATGKGAFCETDSMIWEENETGKTTENYSPSVPWDTTSDPNGNVNVEAWAEWADNPFPGIPDCAQGEWTELEHDTITVCVAN